MTNLRMNAVGRHCAAGLALAALAILPGCVDNDYDLSKDMDLNVTIGTNGLTTPGSSTQVLTLHNLFDLNADGSSSIKVIGENDPQKYGLSVGDYVLIQKPDNATTTKVSVPDITFDGANINGGENNPTLHLTIPSVPDQYIPLDITDISPDGLTNSIDIVSDEVPDELITLSRVTANTPITIGLSIQGNNIGDVYIEKGFEIHFPKYCVISLDKENTAPVTIKDGNVIEFIDRIDIFKTPLAIKANLSELNFEGITDQGLVNREFVIKDHIVYTGGIGLDTSNLDPGDASLTLNTKLSIETVTIQTVTGKINPKIDIAASDFNINDIPPFLTEEGNHLDLYNPQLYFNVNNPAPVDVSFSAILTPYDKNGQVLKNKEGEPIYIKLGSIDGGDEILIKANDDTRICISRRGSSDAEVDENIAVANLSDLFMTVPSRVTITDIHAQVPQNKEYTIVLGQDYDETYTYEAVIPFVFGENTTIEYITSSDDLDTDDLDQLNFDSIELSFNVVNDLPMNLAPTLEATDANGDPLRDIVCKVSGTIAAGTATGPSTSKIKAILSSTADNLGQMKGISANFTANTDRSCAGVPLNENMGVKFTDVTATVKGNIDIDLND